MMKMVESTVVGEPEEMNNEVMMKQMNEIVKKHITMLNQELKALSFGSKQ